MSAPADRRRARRRQTLEEHGIVRARVRPGNDVVVVDVSAGGALVESAHRLLPGSRIELHLASANRAGAIRGRVLRCIVAGLGDGGIRYRGAITFEADLSWFRDEGDGYDVPILETRVSLPERGEATPTGR